MARKYDPIWERIKAVKVGEEVPVKVHATAAKTLRHGVWDAKSRETAIKKQLGMPSAGKLKIREVAAVPSGYVILFFKLEWDGTRL